MNFLILFLTLIYPGYDFLTVEPYPGPPSAVSSGVISLYSNPASIGDAREVLFSQNYWLTDSKITNFSFVYSGWGVKVTYYNFGNFEFQDETPNDEGGVNFTPYAFLGGMAKKFRIDDETSFGFGLDYFYFKIYESSVQNVLLNAGVYYDPLAIPALKVGFSITNFGLKAGFDDITYKMPTRALFTLAYSFGALAVNYTYDRVLTYSKEWFVLDGLGVEHRFVLSYRFFDFLEMSASYSKGREIDPLSVGLQLKKGRFRVLYDVRPAKLSFDPIHIFALIIDVK